jgi:hypothetical protein
MTGTDNIINSKSDGVESWVTVLDARYWRVFSVGERYLEV